MSHPAVRPVLAVSTAVFREGRVLLARRGAALGRGLWSLPGGKVEPGETLAEGAARELAEEVGVTGAIIGVAGALDIIRRDPSGALEAHYVVVCHAAHWRSGEASVGPEAAETGWFAPDMLPEPRTMTDGLAGMIAAAAALAVAGGDGA